MDGATVSLIISGVMCFIGIATFILSRTKDTKEEAQETADRFSGVQEGLLKANLKLDQVCSTTNETRADIKAMRNDVVELDKRVTVIRRDLDTAWKRIDELKEKVNL